MSTEERLEKLESDIRILKDKDEIWRLISRYARAMDEEIDDELAAIFTDDVGFETVPWSGGENSGRDFVIRAFKGSDSATAWSNWLVLHAHDGESYTGWGSYDWECRREDGVWLFSKMVITVDCMTTLEKGWGDAASLVAQYPDKQRK
jgi:hypothetical protein